MKTGLSYDPRFLNHDTGQGHPERSARVEGAMEHLRNQAWFDNLHQLPPVPADRQWLQTTHDGAYIDRIADIIDSGADFVDTPDVAVSAESFEVARLASGAVLGLADELIAGDIDNGFALVRPPGHHAESSSALGFCLFNNIAIGARYLQQHHGLEKIAILDWDVHHGNGTQHTFEQDPSVLFLSTHQYPYYPGTGAASETGEGAGRGSVVNCPMSAGMGDNDYELAFVEQILPAIDRFAPDAILVSAGFDAHKDDPLGSIQLSTAFYAWATLRVLELADKHCDGRVLSVLEGGYDLHALADCVATHVATLSDSTNA